MINELAVHAAGADQHAETRRQVYNEAQTFRQSPLFTQKVRLASCFSLLEAGKGWFFEGLSRSEASLRMQVRLETKLDEHELLRVQLEALDSQEKSGAFLTDSDFYYRYPQCYELGPQLLGEDEASTAPPDWSVRRQVSTASPQVPPLPTQTATPLPVGGTGSDADFQSRWNLWLERQRARGWFPSSTLAYSTLLGAVVGASNFTAYWTHLQTWGTSMFVVPYIFYLFTVGLPALQLEVSTKQVGTQWPTRQAPSERLTLSSSLAGKRRALRPLRSSRLQLILGNLLRGASVKQHSQLNKYLVGLGVFQVLTCMAFVILTSGEPRPAARPRRRALKRWRMRRSRSAEKLKRYLTVGCVVGASVLSSQLLLYFLASFAWPQPWQVTVQDMQECNKFHNDEERCNAFAAGALCSFVPTTKNCIASPTGKVGCVGFESWTRVSRFRFRQRLAQIEWLEVCWVQL